MSVSTVLISSKDYISNKEGPGVSRADRTLFIGSSLFFLFLYPMKGIMIKPHKSLMGREKILRSNLVMHRCHTT
jgi:hypothetical protein